MDEYMTQGSLVIWWVEQFGRAVASDGVIDDEYRIDREYHVDGIGYILHSVVPVGILYHDLVDPRPGICVL